MKARLTGKRKKELEYQETLLKTNTKNFLKAIFQKVPSYKSG